MDPSWKEESSKGNPREKVVRLQTLGVSRRIETCRSKAVSLLQLLEPLCIESTE
jgi:hypothetical protein